MAPFWENWEPRERATLCFVRRENEVLLIRKKRGLGAGKINGPGGRIEPGETPAECRASKKSRGCRSGELLWRGTGRHLYQAKQEKSSPLSIKLLLAEKSRLVLFQRSIVYQNQP